MKKSLILMLASLITASSLGGVVVEAKEKKDNIQAIQISQKSSIEVLVERFYWGFMNRIPDNEGKAFWINELESKKKSVADVISTFIKSPEFIEKSKSSEEFIKRSYMGILGRQPDKEGFEFWLECYNDGYSKNFVLANHFNSNEFQKFIKILPVKTGTMNVELGDRVPEVEDLVENFYIGFHNRIADNNGLKYWTEQIVNEKKSIASVVEGFINSSEFQNDNVTIDIYIKKIYKGLLGRIPDQGGRDYWLGKYINGYSKKYILSNVFNSNEFQNDLKKIGIKKIGNIDYSNKDIPEYRTPKAIVRNTTINLRSKPNLNARTNINLPIGTEVTLLDRVKGDEVYYKVKVVYNGKIEEGYIRKTVNWKEVLEIYVDDKDDSYLGVLSEKYESNGDPGLISTGVGDYGGKSYGAWQFSSTMGSLNEFVNSLKNTNKDFYDRLVNAKKKDNNTFGTEFDKVWKDIAKTNYELFYDLQHDYIKNKYYKDIVKKIVGQASFSEELGSFAARNVIWSTAVQHGVTGGSKILIPTDNEKNVSGFIKAVYTERGRKDSSGILVHFANNSQEVQNGVAKRFVNEEKEALSVLNLENGGKSIGKKTTEEKVEITKTNMKSSEAMNIAKDKYGEDDDVIFTIPELTNIDGSEGYKITLKSKTLINKGGTGVLFSIFVSDKKEILVY